MLVNAGDTIDAPIVTVKVIKAKTADIQYPISGSETIVVTGDCTRNEQLFCLVHCDGLLFCNDIF